MVYAMKQKISMIDEFISKAKEIEASKNEIGADRLVSQVLGIYSAEIPGIQDNLSRFKWKFGDERTDNLFDVALVRKKLENHKLNLQSGLYSQFFSGSSASVTVSQNTQQVMENTVTISLEQTISQINELPDDSLSSEEKTDLAGKLAAIIASKDKKSRWDKTKEVLKWIGDKTVDVGIATLPFILQSLQ